MLDTQCSLPRKFKCDNREEAQEYRGTRWEEWFRHQLLPELRKEAEMSELERLCVMLHEQGVDHVRNDFGVTWDYYGSPHTADESIDGTLIVTGLTPEQVMTATVGEEYEMHICKRCGVAYELNIIDREFGKSRFCPNCGYKELYQ